MQVKWAELINVRSTVSNAAILAATLHELMNDMVGNKGNETIRVFRREKLDSDICIVLLHSGNKTNAGVSPLALRLVAAIKEIALVHHTIWYELVT